MPKRSFRSKLNKNKENKNSISTSSSNNKNNNSDYPNNNNNNNTVSTKNMGKDYFHQNSLGAENAPVEIPKALESEFGHHEMKRQIAEALRETSLRNNKSKAFSKKSRSNNGSLNSRNGNPSPNNSQNAKSLFESLGVTAKKGTLADKEISKMMLNYSDVVRNPKMEKEAVDLSVSEIMNNVRSTLDAEVDGVFVRSKESASESIGVDESIRACESSLECNDRDRSICGKDTESNCELSASSEGISKAASLSNLLANLDPEILHELEMDDTTWEVISIGDWSHCGSDSEDQFYLISRDDASTVTTLDEEEDDFDEGDFMTRNDDYPEIDEGNQLGKTMSYSSYPSEDHISVQDGNSGNTETTSETDKTVEKSINTEISGSDNTNNHSSNTKTRQGSKTNSNFVVTNNAYGNSVIPKSATQPSNAASAKASHKSDSSTSVPPPSAMASVGSGALKRKKVVVTRKYIGSVDLEHKLANLGFVADEKLRAAASAVEERSADAAGKAPPKYWKGIYQQGQFEVEAKQRCGLLVVSVRAECESLLIGLTCLQGLIQDTGLLSYANFSLPSLLRSPATAVVN